MSETEVIEEVVREVIYNGEIEYHGETYTVKRKVEVPRFVDDQFNQELYPWYEVDEAKDIPHILRCAYQEKSSGSHEFLEWVAKNPAEYVLAVENGYEIEKESLYYIKFSEKQYAQKFDGNRIDSILVNDKTMAGRFTEKEIQMINPDFMAFAVKVEGVE